MGQNVSNACPNACPNACKKSSHLYNLQLYNLQQVKVRYPKHQRLNLVLADVWSHKILTRYTTHMAIKFRIKLMI